MSPSLHNGHNQSWEELFDGSKDIQDREPVGPRNHVRTSNGSRPCAAYFRVGLTPGQPDGLIGMNSNKY